MFLLIRGMAENVEPRPWQNDAVAILDAWVVASPKISCKSGLESCGCTLQACEVLVKDGDLCFVKKGEKKKRLYCLSQMSVAPLVHRFVFGKSSSLHPLEKQLLGSATTITLPLSLQLFSDATLRSRCALVISLIASSFPCSTYWRFKMSERCRT